jgi:hypothetical protein
VATYSALQLVNRVRLRTRGGGAFADLESIEAQTILQCVNEAKDYVLETRDWEFDHRHDGVLVTQAVVESGTLGVTSGQAAITTSAADMLPVGDFSTRLLVTADAAYATTAVRLVSHSGTAGTLAGAWVGSTNAAAAYKAVVYEYVLPDTVKDVTSVRFQDDELSLDFVAREEGFHKHVPRPTQEISDNPQLIVVGSYVTRTGAAAAGATGLGFLIWPCPLSAYQLDYSYKVRHPLLSATQGLENVPEAQVHDIVLAAFAFYEGSAGKDPDMAGANMRVADGRMARHGAMDSADPNRHRPLRSMDERSGGGIQIGSRPADENIFE